VSLLTWVAAGFVTGVVIGPLLIVLVAPYFESGAKFLVRQGIRAGGDWVLKPVGGTKYDLETVDYDDAEGKAWRAGDDNDEGREYYDDNGGRMRTLFGKSFGIVVEDISAIVDPVDAKLGELEGEKATDGGQLDSDDKGLIEDIRDRAHIGSMEKSYEGGVKRRIDFINPFVEIGEDDETGTIVDVRDAVTLLSKNGSPETPRKTAENAAQAERAFEDWGELKRNASLIAAFLMGAIVTEFIAGGGGGGGGGISVGLSLARPMMDIGLVALGVA
jgi:hypothetical protein